MGSINVLLSETNERTIAQRIGIPHDEARARYPLRENTIDSFDAFNHVIADYYNCHTSSTISNGGRLSIPDAASRAKELLEKEYRRRGADIMTAYSEAESGLDGGLRKILDVIADGLKAQSIENYIRDAFDRCVSPASWEQKVDIIRQFIQQCGTYFSSEIRTDQPERYARNYEELIRAYVESMNQTSSILRRL